MVEKQLKTHCCTCEMSSLSTGLSLTMEQHVVLDLMEQNGVECYHLKLSRVMDDWFRGGVCVCVRVWYRVETMCQLG